jgi:hypothetical protein
VGVERFFQYDTGSTDEHEDVLAPYVHQGIVTVEEWYGEGRQNEAIDHCLEVHADVLRPSPPEVPNPTAPVSTHSGRVPRKHAYQGENRCSGGA